MNTEDSRPAVVGQVEPSVRPRAWMALHGREPAQVTLSQQQADAWAQAGGDVVDLYDGQTVWNAVARAAELERERCAKKPLTRQQIDDVMTKHYPLSSLLREEVDAFEACVRDIERLHGIGA